MKRLVALLILVALAAVPASALAQSSPFGPLPQPVAPTPVPTKAPKTAAEQAKVDKTLLLIIAGAVVIIFVGIARYISRDARKNLTESDRRAVEGQPRPMTDAEKRKSDALKKKARAKTRAQKQARKKQRQRSR